ncbi:MAG: hypothetical protein JRI35_10085 [Deltaproteobacteria bacterium]|nr:hypothetical protein [Deltaproteobacteria bacterium]MBW1947313.1 hypothetical protein [Deltaproteobacteria bacterium]MBW1965922.1 hypothetical protein [Deltaproteobacteria bacterium]MBW2098314.1 hypothetical protein [Deltaproteobacteria bacterium]
MKDPGVERDKMTGAVCYEAFRRLKPVLRPDKDLMIHLVLYSGKVVESFPNRN